MAGFLNSNIFSFKQCVIILRPWFGDTFLGLVECVIILRPWFGDTFWGWSARPFGVVGEVFRGGEDGNCEERRENESCEEWWDGAGVGGKLN